MSYYLQRLVHRAAGLPAPVRWQVAIRPDSIPWDEGGGATPIGIDPPQIAPTRQPGPEEPAHTYERADVQQPYPQAAPQPADSTNQQSSEVVVLQSPPVTREKIAVYGIKLPHAPMKAPAGFVNQPGAFIEVTVKEPVRPVISPTPRQPAFLPSSLLPPSDTQPLARTAVESEGRHETTAHVSPAPLQPREVRQQPPILTPTPTPEPAPVASMEMSKSVQEGETQAIESHHLRPAMEPLTQSPRQVIERAMEQVVIHQLASSGLAVQDAPTAREPAPPTVHVKFGHVEIRGGGTTPRPTKSGFGDLELTRRYLDRSGY